MSYFFVGGAPRTGTSLLQMILCQDETTNEYLHEARYLRDLMAAYVRAQRDFDSFTCHYFPSRQDLSQFQRGMVEGLFASMSSRHDTPEHFVVKEPQMTPFFPYLHELFPEALFVCMVRDPLDTVASLVKVGERERSEGIRSVLAERDMVKLSNIIKSYYVPLLDSGNQRFLRSVMFVRYEDTVLNTEHVVQDLREFTGLALKDAAPREGLETGVVDFSDVSDEQSRWLTELYGKPVSSKSVGKHKSVLTPAEIATVRSECSDFIAAFGLEPACA